MLLAGISGTAAGLLYLRARRNLWPSIVLHGVLDTIGFVTLFVVYQCCAGALGR
jgi:membrane protease YdiL (CAAX protease family)